MQAEVVDETDIVKMFPEKNVGARLEAQTLVS
jgi:hypothetical protein